MAISQAGRIGKAGLAARIRLGDSLFAGLVGAAALTVLLVILGLFYELTGDAWIAIEKFGLEFVWTTEWNPPQEVFGAGALVVGTIITSLAALILATAVGLMVALYLTQVAPPFVARPLSYMVELLAAIPSVVYGLWGIFVLGVFIRDSFGPKIVVLLGWIPIFDGTPLITGLLSAILILSIMILPTVTAVSRDVLAAVPGSQREGVLALGATRWEMIRMAVLPYARSGVLGAAILGLARAVGETLAVTMVIGNRRAIPHTIFDAAYTMPSIIANEFSEVENKMHEAALLEVGLLLLVITFVINVIARLLVWRVTKGQRAVVQE
jgi:phosphate transport system permease protein